MIRIIELSRWLGRVIRFEEELQPHQKRVIERMRKQNGLVVAHGLGSGKTRTAIETHKALGGKADVIVPAALRGNYEKEMKKWGADPGKTTIHSQQNVSRKGLETESDLMIVDEGHRARNPKSKLSGAIKNATSTKRLILTGSPIYNRPEDIGTLVNQAAGKPVLHEGTDFKNRYQKPGFFTRITGGRISHKAELKKYLKEYVDYHPGDESKLPKVKEETVSVPMGSHQSNLYRAAIGKIPMHLRASMAMKGVNQGNIDRLKPYLTGPRMVSNSSNALDAKSHEEPKIDRMFRDLRDHLKDPKGKALIYSNYIKHGVEPIRRRMDQEGIPYGEFTGKRPMKERNQTVRDYNEGKTRALLVSSSGGEGLDLKGTRMVQIMEPHFNNQKLKQVIGRSARMGSHDHLPESDRNVIVKHYVARPRRKFLLGTKKGVDEMLRESSNEKDKTDRQIMSMLR